MSTEILASCAKTKQAETAKTSAVNIVRFIMRQNPRNLPGHFDVNPQERRPRRINRKQDHDEKAATGRRRSRHPVLRWNPTLCAQEIERRIATATPPNRLTTQRRLLRRAGGDAQGFNKMRFGSNLNLTPARTGLIMVALLWLGAIVVRVTIVSEHSEVRTHTTRENGAGATLDIGVADLRRSLP
jgi:hypothetical protein